MFCTENVGTGIPVKLLSDVSREFNGWAYPRKEDQLRKYAKQTTIVMTFDGTHRATVTKTIPIVL